MVTDDPYGIRNLRLAVAVEETAEKDPILTDTYLKVANREYNACQYCGLRECAPTSRRCLLRNLKRKTNPQGRIILENMFSRGASVDDIMDATGYTRKTTLRYIRLYQRKMQTGPCQNCSSRSICESYHGTCREKEMWRRTCGNKSRNQDLSTSTG